MEVSKIGEKPLTLVRMKKRELKDLWRLVKRWSKNLAVRKDKGSIIDPLIGVFY
jgi:hypothetical protein